MAVTRLVSSKRTLTFRFRAYLKDKFISNWTVKFVLGNIEKKEVQRKVSNWFPHFLVYDALNTFKRFYFRSVLRAVRARGSAVKSCTIYSCGIGK